MFCVIQKIQKKKSNEYGAAKELLTNTDILTIDGEEVKLYGYNYSKERFERPILDAYKISIHHSYRENGKVKKKQWSICTMSYYDIIYHCFDDAVVKSVLDAKINEMGVKRSKFYRMVYDKLNPLEEAIRAEYEQTDEYKTHQLHIEVLEAYRIAKAEFEQLYGKDTYNRIYDVFGNVRNKEYLEQLIAVNGNPDEARKAQEEYQRRSQEESQKRFEEQFKSGWSGSSYSSASHSNYNENEKTMLKEIYRMASKKFHPDACGDDGSKMKFLTKLKEQWEL